MSVVGIGGVSREAAGGPAVSSLDQTPHTMQIGRALDDQPTADPRAYPV